MGGRIVLINNRIKFEQINWNQLKPCINHLKLQTTPLKPIETFQTYAVAKLQQLWFLMQNNSNMHTGRHQIQEKVVHGSSVLAFIFTKPQVNETTVTLCEHSKGRRRRKSPLLWYCSRCRCRRRTAHLQHCSHAVADAESALYVI